MTGRASRQKGARAEREVAALLSDHLGVTVKRRYNLGTQEDIGDLIGLDDTCIQVADRPSDILRAVREKPVECELQRQQMGATFAASFIRFRGGDYRVVMTTDQFCTWWREAVGS